MRKTVTSLVLPIAMFILLRPIYAQEIELSLGKLEFENSGSADAQANFINGVLALHSFWFEEARDQFRQAQRIDPSFAMAYWGEAITFAPPSWAPMDYRKVESGRSVLGKVDSLAAHNLISWSPREKAYIDAVRILHSGENMEDNREAYTQAMEELVSNYPEDKEAIIFTALARMCELDFNFSNSDDVVSVAAPLEELFMEMPEHPGVLHYLIHVYDSYEYAPLGLRQARIYAKIAPSASHALHMPSHIFKALGMWEEVVASNVDAWNASVRWQQRTNRSVAQRDFHAFDWLVQAYSKLGQFRNFDAIIDTLDQMIEQVGDNEMELSMLRDIKNRNDLSLRMMKKSTGFEVEIPPVTEEDLSSIQPGPPFSLLGLAIRASFAGQDSLYNELMARAENFDYPPPLIHLKHMMDPLLTHVRATDLLNKHKYKEAYTLLDSLEIREPNAHMGTDPVLQLKASLLTKMEKYQESYALLKTLTKYEARDPFLQLNMASVALDMENEKLALSHYEKLLAIWHSADKNIPAYQEALKYVREHTND